MFAGGGHRVYVGQWLGSQAASWYPMIADLLVNLPELPTVLCSSDLHLYKHGKTIEQEKGALH